MDRQKEILQVFNMDFDLVLTKKEIIENGKIGYYHNTQKHVGEVLSRMVKNGSLKRVKKGSYSLGSGLKKQEIDKNQTEISWEK